MDERFARHRQNSKALIADLQALGLKPVVAEDYRLLSSNAVWIPEKIDDQDVRTRFRNGHLITIVKDNTRKLNRRQICKAYDKT